MENIAMNRKAVHILEGWDPFEMGNFTYDTEAADVVAELQHIDDPTVLGKKIQEIYEQSFERWIPIEKCVEISYKLLAVKFEAKCIV
ncbi:DUF1871 family protein [Viridibacillus sp. YIM B01967]|jgi:hypothetical protein|uniref:DUF1871 family protein n=1 Tax=Viridibacillus soli TaxID=2798301 RepID=A0ABS1H9W5_9BACL|nr:DUF1871 family protein [Viridibacillus soli]MBK3496195.1 DUF1871 family protein [Viridibacillus soli]